MRTLLVVTGALFVLSVPSVARAVPSLSDEAGFAANSSRKFEVRLAQSQGNDKGQGSDHRQTVSPSKGNNGFGNGGEDGVPGRSGKQDTTR